MMRHTCLCHSFWQCEFTRDRKQVVNKLKSLQGLSTLVSGVKFPQGEGSVVIYRKRNDLLHKAATYMSVSEALAFHS